MFESCKVYLSAFELSVLVGDVDHGKVIEKTLLEQSVLDVR